MLHREKRRYRVLANELARRLRALRDARGWTQERAAEAIGIEPLHVRRLESARANPSLAVLLSVASAYGINVAALLAPGEEWRAGATRTRR